MNECKVINILKTLNITPQKPISNSITKFGLDGPRFPTEPILDTRFTNEAQLQKTTI